MASAMNRDNEEAYFSFPTLCFFSLQPDTSYFQAGQNVNRLIFLHQQLQPAHALLGFVRHARSDFPSFLIIVSKDLPDLAKALKYPMWGNVRGVGVKVTYDLNGRPVEEEFS